jgi:hypothetical protein
VIFLDETLSQRNRSTKEACAGAYLRELQIQCVCIISQRTPQAVDPSANINPNRDGADLRPYTRDGVCGLPTKGQRSKFHINMYPRTRMRAYWTESECKTDFLLTNSDETAPRTVTILALRISHPDCGRPQARSVGRTAGDGRIFLYKYGFRCHEGL